MALRYNKKLVIIMIMLILLSCTSCGVKQSKDKQEAKKKITREGDYSYANSTDIEFVKSKFPNIEEIKSVSYIMGYRLSSIPYLVLLNPEGKVMCATNSVDDVINQLKNALKD